MKDLMLETGFTFDSREVKKDSIFIALSGGLRDGNDFAKKAFEAGAKFLILSKKRKSMKRKGTKRKTTRRRSYKKGSKRRRS